MNIRIHDIISESIVDGPGFRYVIFSQGCKHHCKECFNPSTHDFKGGYLKDIDEILNEIKSNEELLRGVTFSGGDPFEQTKEFTELAKRIRQLNNNLDIWSYTGYTFEQIIKDPDKLNLLKQLDVLVDGRFDINLKDETLFFRGSSNQRIIDVQKSLKNNVIETLYFSKF